MTHNKSGETNYIVWPLIVLFYIHSSNASNHC